LSRAAVRQYWSFARSDSVTEFLDHFHRQPIAIDWDHLKSDPLRLAFRCYVTGCWLADIFAIRAVADYGRETLGRDRGNIGGLDL